MTGEFQAEAIYIIWQTAHSVCFATHAVGDPLSHAVCLFERRYIERFFGVGTMPSLSSLLAPDNK